jgi:hypothetical protein
MCAAPRLVSWPVRACWVNWTLVSVSCSIQRLQLALSVNCNGVETEADG